jgi:hypothetical protein
MACSVFLDGSFLALRSLLLLSTCFMETVTGGALFGKVSAVKIGARAPLL